MPCRNWPACSELLRDVNYKQPPQYDDSVWQFQAVHKMAVLSQVWIPSRLRSSLHFLRPVWSEVCSRLEPTWTLFRFKSQKMWLIFPASLQTRDFAGHFWLFSVKRFFSFKLDLFAFSKVAPGEWSLIDTFKLTVAQKTLWCVLRSFWSFFIFLIKC